MTEVAAGQERRREEAQVRVGFNASFFRTGNVGIGLWIQNMVRELAESWKLTVYSSVPDAFEYPGVVVKRIPGWTGDERGRFLWVYTTLPRLLARDRVDVVLSPFVESPITRIPSIAVIHDLIPLRVPGSCPLRYTLRFRLSLNLLKRASAVVAISTYTRDDVRRTGLYRDDQVHTITCGTRLGSAAEAIGHELMDSALAGLLARGLRRDEPFLLYVGGFLPHKNLPLLLGAFSEVKSKIPHRLVLVGAMHPFIEDPLMHQVRQLGLQDRVLVLTDVSTEQLVFLYRRCELFVFPSNYEGFGMPVLEAMACGAPVLCSNSSSLPEVGGDAVRYFAPDARAELVTGIMELLTDVSARARLSALGRARAQQFTWRRTADCFSDLIRSLLQKGSS